MTDIRKDPGLMKSRSVITSLNSPMLSITLNRPSVINSLDVEMIRLIQDALDEAESSPSISLVLIKGAGDKGFCAGGDIKAIYNAVKQGDPDRGGMIFFREEYELDLRIFKFPKPIIVLAHGITMGGGLGLAAGADMVVATENTIMAMPETRIGFFPDVGATGWMFSKCPAGYPEFLGLTGYSQRNELCQASLTKLSENSPTGLALTLCLLRSNEKRTIEDVYRKDLKAARFMIKHPDYAEGIRAQLVDKNKNPVWQPGAIDEISLPDFC